MKENINYDLKKFKGLTDEEVIKSRNKYGANTPPLKKKETLLIKILKIFKEPMFLLLIIAASIYFLVQEYMDGLVMLFFVLAICLIEFIQSEKTDKALKELTKLTSLNVKVIRNGKIKIIRSEEVVVSDIVILEEGDRPPADGKLLYMQSLGVNESSLTGESTVVYKTIEEDNKNHFKSNMLYFGTDVVNGMGVIEVSAVYEKTELGLIGNSLNNIKKEKTPLEKQVNKLVLICTIISSIIFILTIIVNYINNYDLILKDRIIKSILSGITVAMATIPEEIPVILTVFLAMGALQLTKSNTLIRNKKAIETLGAVEVICLDKTGTITENKMIVKDSYIISNTFYNTAYYACLKVPYDSMELSIKDYCKNKLTNEKMTLTKEYAFTFKTKMTGQIWNNNYLCVKGAYENILPLCNLTKEKYDEIIKKINTYSSKGYRVLVIAKNDNLQFIPKEISDVSLSFEGLIALYDPERIGVKESLAKCFNASIRVIIITGDSKETAKGIAKRINLKNYDEVITGDELENMTDSILEEKVKTVNMFARVYPNHKMRIIEALQKNAKITAMTGDGINDSSALKMADIGISMGKGTNVCKEASDIILVDDNFKTIITAIENGRNIYKNIKKSISYIIAIHIPIALLSLFIPMLKLPNLLLPIHVMLLELIIDPTSSIIFQRIKSDKDIMLEKPRNIKEPILNLKNLLRCIFQGLLIFIVVFLTYYFLITSTNQSYAITISYSVLVLAITFITYELKSSKLTIINFLESLKDKVSLIIISFVIISLLLFTYLPFFNNIANTTPIDLKSWFLIIGLVLLAVIPFDILKLKK